MTVDLVNVLEALPGPNQKILGVSQRIEVGGPAANAARVAAALGLPVTLIAPYGVSPLTDYLRATLLADGVAWLDPIAGQPNPSPMSSVLVDHATGDRAVISGGAPALESVPSWLAERIAALLKDAAAVLVDGHGGALPAAVAAAGQAAELPVLLDGGSYKSRMATYLPDVGLAVLSADFRAPGSGDPLGWCLAAGARAAAVSSGAESIRMRCGATDSVIPVPRAPRVVDTLGAGDVLHGAALAALAYAPTPSTYAAVLTFAAQVATASVGYPGALGWAADPAVVARSRRALAALA